MCWACDHPGGGHQAYLRQISELIERHGWAVQYVEGECTRAPYAYTVGLTAAGLPELVVTGLPAVRAAALLNEVAGSTRFTEPPVPGGTISLSAGGEVEVVRLPNPEARLYVASELFGRRVRAMQLVWVDDRGRSPWHPVFRGRRGGQQVLGPRELAS